MARKRYFEWIAGESLGEIVTLESIETIDGETFYNFDDGESCNVRYISKMTSSSSALKEKFMVEITSPSNPWTTETIQPKRYIDESMKGQDIEIPTLHDMLQATGSGDVNIEDSDIGRQKLVPPKGPQGNIDLPRPEDYPVKTKPVRAHVEQQPIQQAPIVKEEPKQEIPVAAAKPEQKVQPYNPVHILVDTCKKQETEVSLDLNIMLPSRYIYGIAANEFENGVEDFIDYVVSKIDTTMIINELKIALINAYQTVDGPVVQEK